MPKITSSIERAAVMRIAKIKGVKVQEINQLALWFIWRMTDPKAAYKTPHMEKIRKTYMKLTTTNFARQVEYFQQITRFMARRLASHKNLARTQHRRLTKLGFMPRPVMEFPEPIYGDGGLAKFHERVAKKKAASKLIDELFAGSTKDDGDQEEAD